MAGGMFYGAGGWDPVLIVAQMATMQAIYYASLGAFLYVFLAFGGGAGGGRQGTPLTVEFVFDYTKVSAGGLTGWLVFLSLACAAVAGAVGLYVVVERTKKCLDFTATVFGFHALLCWSYRSFPASVEWWGSIAVSAVVMTVLGEWLCMKKEMRDIPLAIGPSRRSRERGSSRGARERGSLLQFMSN